MQTITLRRKQLNGLLRIAYGMGAKGLSINEFATEMTDELNKLRWNPEDQDDKDNHC